MNDIICAALRCKNTFARSGRRKFCSNACKTAHSRDGVPKSPFQKGRIKNSDNQAAHETAHELTIEYYRLQTNAERNKFLQGVICSALENVRYRRAITNPSLLKPCDYRTKFMKKYSPEQRNIADMCDRYCMQIFGKPIHQMVKISPDFTSVTVLDLSQIDNRFAYKNSVCKPLNENEVEALIQNRPKWVVDYYKAVIAAGKPANEQQQPLAA